MTILIAEDSKADALILRNIVSRSGHTIHLARDGEEALRMLDDHPEICLVLTDMRMPGMDGVELLRAMRDRPDLGEIPVVFVSGVDDAETVKAAASLAPAGYILKPLREPSVILERVERILAATLPFVEDAEGDPALRSAQADLAPRLRELMGGAPEAPESPPSSGSLDGLADLARSARAYRLIQALDEGESTRSSAAFHRLVRGTLHALEAAGV